MLERISPNGQAHFVKIASFAGVQGLSSRKDCGSVRQRGNQKVVSGCEAVMLLFNANGNAVEQIAEAVKWKNSLAGHFKIATM